MPGLTTRTLGAGTLVGRYEVVRCIGRGGMGEVYEAVHQVTGRRVALKVASGMGLDEELRQRFLREAQAAAALDHPNVVDVLDAFEDRAGPVLVMELLRGESLGDVFRRGQRFDLAALAPIVVPVCRALKAAHARGMVHRDLKPDNIFLALVADTGVVPKLLDFGIVKVRPGDVSFSQEGHQTQTGAILGTPFYMSFEQAMGEREIDHRADIWSLGVIVYKALSGRRPLEFNSLGEMYQAFLEGQIAPIRTLAPALPDDVAVVVDAMVRVRREARLADLDPLIEAMCAHASLHALSARPFLPEGRASVPPMGGPDVASVLDRTTSLDPTATAPSPGLTPANTARAWQTEAASSKAGLVPASFPLPSKRRPWGTLAPGLTLLVLVGALGVGGLMLTRGEATSPSGGSAPEIEEPAAPASPADLDTEAPSTGTRAAPSAEVGPEPSPTGAPAAKVATATLPAPPPAPPSAPVKAEEDACVPPYVIDEKGVKRFKPECL